MNNYYKSTVYKFNSITFSNHPEDKSEAHLFIFTVLDILYRFQKNSKILIKMQQLMKYFTFLIGFKQTKN